jgi:hypothetical protein
MNQSIKYSPDGYYDINAGNIRTVSGDTVEIDHQLIIGNLPVDVSNDDIITVDNLGRLYKLDKASLPSGNPFDQLLNTTDDVEFSTCTLTNTTNDNSENRVLVLDTPTNTIQYRDASTIGGNPFNQNLNTTDDVIFNSLKTDNIQEENFNAGVSINSRLILPNITPANSVNDVLTVDMTSNNVERTLASIDSLGNFITPGDISCDNLTSTGNVKCNKISIPNTTQLSANVNSQVEINRGVISSFSINADGGLYPKLSISDKDVALGGQQTSFVSFGAYNKNDAVGTFTASDTDYIIYERKHGEAKFTFLGGENQTPGDNVTDFQLIQDIGTDQIKFYKKIIVNSTVIDNTNTRFLTLDPTTDEVQETDINGLGLGDVLGPASSIDNAIARFDGISGKVIKNSGVTIGGFLDNDISTGGTISCQTQTIAGEDDPDFVIVKVGDDILRKVSLLNLFGQNLFSSSNVVFNNVFSNGLIQTDQILENTLNNGVNVAGWQIKSQDITSDGLISLTTPMAINMKIFGDNDIPLSIITPNHDDMGINFDLSHVSGFVDNYVSGSVNGNFIIDKTSDTLRILAQNGIAKGGALLKSAMNSVMEWTKTTITLNENATFTNAILADNLTVDPQTESILLTQNSVSGEFYKRDYQAVYGTATAINSNLNLALPVINTYVHVTPGLAFGSPLKNCTVPIGDEIVIDAGISTFRAVISYNVTLGSGVNPAETYQTAIQITSSTVTASQMTTVTFDSNQQNEVSCTFIATLTGNDTIGLYVRNVNDTVNVLIEDVTITINKIFE